MINKQNLWFVTLFSLILVLGIYYVSLKDDSISVLSEATKEDISTAVEVTESDVLVALRVEEDETILKEMEEYQEVLLNAEATLEEKNDAYESLQALNTQKGEKEQLENLIKEKFNMDSFVKISRDQINVTIAKSNHNTEVANNIIRTIQEKYDTQKYITVKFN